MGVSQPEPAEVGGGYLEQGVGAGVKYQNVYGAVLASGGGTGLHEITLLAPYDGFAENQLMVDCGPGFGSALAPGVGFGCSSISASVFFIETWRLDTGVLVDLPIWFRIFTRPRTT